MARKSKSDVEREERYDIEIAKNRELCKTNQDKIAMAKKYPSWKTTKEEKMLYAESMIPESAKRLFADDIDKYRGIFIAGWLGDSQCIRYGWCDGANRYNNTLHISQYSFYVSWEPTLQEMLKLFKNTSLVNEFQRIRK